MHRSCFARWVVGLALIASSASRAMADEVVLWSPLREAKGALEKLAVAYNAMRGSEAPKVKVVHFDWNGFGDRVSATVPRGKGPDIFIFPQDCLGGWVESGNVVEPLDCLLDRATKDRCIPAALQAMTYRGALYGLPLSYNLLALYYNKKLVNVPPRTTAELADFARALTRRVDRVYGLAYRYRDYYFLGPLQNGFGARLFDEGGLPLLDSPQNLGALRLLLAWKEFLPDDEFTTEQVGEMFNEGRAAMVFEGPWFRADIAPSVAYGVTLLPTVSEAGDRPMRPWLTVDGLYLAATSTRKTEAYAFMKYLADTEAAKVLALTGTQLPANQKVYLDPAIATDQALTTFFRQASVAVAMPNIPEMTVMWPRTFVALATAIDGSATPDRALARAQAEVTRAVAALHSPRPPQK